MAVAEVLSALTVGGSDGSGGPDGDGSGGGSGWADSGDACAVVGAGCGGGVVCAGGENGING